MQVRVTIDASDPAAPRVEMGVVGGADFPEARERLEALARRLGVKGIRFTTEPQVEQHRHDNEEASHVHIAQHTY